MRKNKLLPQTSWYVCVNIEKYPFGKYLNNKSHLQINNSIQLNTGIVTIELIRVDLKEIAQIESGYNIK